MHDDSDNNLVANAVESLALELSSCIGGCEGDDQEYDSLTEAVADVASRLKRVGDAITPNICGGKDATGGHVESLTEAVMGVTAALSEIAGAINNLADAVGQRQG